MMMMTPRLLVAVVVLWVVTVAFARSTPSRGPTKYVPYKILRKLHVSSEDSNENDYKNAAEVSESVDSSRNGHGNTAVVTTESVDILDEYFKKWENDMDILRRRNVKYGINLSDSKLSNDTEAGVDPEMVKGATPKAQDEVQDSTLGKARGEPVKLKDSSRNGHGNTAVNPRESMDILDVYIKRWQKNMDILIHDNVKYGLNLSSSKLSDDTETAVAGVQTEMVKGATPKVQDEVQDSKLGKARGEPVKWKEQSTRNFVDNASSSTQSEISPRT